MTVSVIIVSFDTADLTLRAIDSVFQSTGVDVEVWLVDNASRDETVARVRERFPGVHVLEMGENVGFGAANNAAFERVRGPLVLLLNSDAMFLDPADLGTMVEAMTRDPTIGVLGPRLLGSDGVRQISARRFPTPGREFAERFQLYRMIPRSLRVGWLLGHHFAHDRVVECDWVSGACLLLRRRVFLEVGGFDPDIFMYGEEQEWQYRIDRTRWRVVFDPRVTVLHERASGSATRAEWRVRAALSGDRYLWRKHSGSVRRVAFDCVRLLGFLWEWGLFSTPLARGPAGYRRSRRDAARLQFRLWWELLRSPLRE